MYHPQLSENTKIHSPYTLQKALIEWLHFAFGHAGIQHVYAALLLSVIVPN